MPTIEATVNRVLNARPTCHVIVWRNDQPAILVPCATVASMAARWRFLADQASPEWKVHRQYEEGDLMRLSWQRSITEFVVRNEAGEVVDTLRLAKEVDLRGATDRQTPAQA